MTRDTMLTTDHGDGTLTVSYLDAEIKCANGYVARVVSRVAHENTPDAEWAAKVLNRYGHLVTHPADSREPPEPCTDTARALGCTCTIPHATAYDIDPPEPKRSRDCPLHGGGADPDALRERDFDRKHGPAQ